MLDGIPFALIPFQLLHFRIGPPVHMYVGKESLIYIYSRKKVGPNSSALV